MRIYHNNAKKITKINVFIDYYLKDGFLLNKNLPKLVLSYYDHLLCLFMFYWMQTFKKLRITKKIYKGTNLLKILFKMIWFGGIDDELICFFFW